MHTINNFVESDDNEYALKSKEHALEKSNQLEVSQSNKVRNNGDKQKPQNIDDGRKNMYMIKCHEKHRKQQGENMKEMQSVNLATTSTDLNVNSLENHEELHTTEDKHNEDMYAIVISSDHDMVHMINEQQQEFSKSIISANTIVQCRSSSSMGTTSENQCTKRDNNMAILVVPTVLQSDEDQVLRVHSKSPNKALHDILIHKDVEHLARSGSDHAPMLPTCEEKITSKKKPFRFLKFWTEHVTFKDVVRLNLDFTTSSNPFLDFKRNIK
ncbi:hypothetical protein R3W88_001070 [Solanum pinnatisectum]|uniref:Uncharacterized protein n=1 Tax=Solanum pinnatisectum TaxID=50273 RepID=A0AAV9MHQ5_9SOLN|nr:hypothetical protein R3W88_001070 [Solanum pinnatisectum]